MIRSFLFILWTIVEFSGCNLDDSEFKRLVDIGHGRAVVFLQTNSAAPYRDIILNVCLHNMALDRQSEGSRAPYMMDIIELTSEKAFYRDHIITALRELPTNDEDWDGLQLINFAQLFALEGDTEARQLIYGRFDNNPGDMYAADEIIELDGLQGFQHVAARLGELDADQRDDIMHGDHYLSILERQSSEEEVAAALEQNSDPRIAAYLDTVNALRERYKQNRQKSKIDVTTIRFEDIERSIDEELTDGLRSSGILSEWGKQASENDLVRAAHKIENETDTDKLWRYLAIFRKISFPLDYNILMAQIPHSDWHVATSAIVALSNNTDLAIRAYALDMIAKSFRPGRMMQVLLKNLHLDSDWHFITEITGRRLDPEEYHDLGFNVLDIIDLYPDHDWTQALLSMYENGTCAICRERVVKRLYHRDAIPSWMIEECRYDSNLDLREKARKNFVGLEPGW